MFEELIAKGLVKQKRYDNGLSVFKYSREVFYKSLWNTDPLLLEARGMVLDDEGNKVIWPFTKVFNHHENGTELELDAEVIAPRKVNGFLAAARWYHDELVISTTGTLDSEYAELARDYIEKLLTRYIHGEYTYIFEICSPKDPHIVEEEEGAWLIGMRCMESGAMVCESTLDYAALCIEAKRPEVFHGTFREVLALLEECKHEGYMVRCAWTGETFMKLKSPHYLSKKFLMRMSGKKVDAMYENTSRFLETIDEEFYDVINYIVEHITRDEWKSFSDQERRAWIEDYFHCTR